MPIQTACPNCDASYKLPDDKLGKKVRCKKCEETFTVSNGAKAGSKAKEGIQAKAPQRKVSPKKPDDDDVDDDDGDDKGKGKKKKKKGKTKNKSNAMIWIGLGGGLLLVGIAVGAYFFFTGSDTTPAPPPPSTSKKGKNDKGDKSDPAGGNTAGTEGGDSTKTASDNFPSLTSLNKDDPIRVNFEKLLLDRQRNPEEVKSAVEFFARADPKLERDVNGLLFGFKDHSWRKKVAKELERLIYSGDLRSKVFWEAYANWATPAPDDFARLKEHLERAGEFRAMLMEKIADFRTPEAAQVLADRLTTTEKEVARRLLKDMGGRLCVKPVFPYLWHPEKAVMEIADELVKGYDTNVDHPLYKGPSATYPRLPPPPPGLTLDATIGILTTPNKGGWQSPERFNQLKALGWLEKELPQFGPSREKMSKALDALLLVPDYPLAFNALECLSNWTTEQNLATLKKHYDSNSGPSKNKAARYMKAIPGAQKMLVAMWPEMDPELQKEMNDFMKLSINNDDAKAQMLGLINHGNGLIRTTARETAGKWFGADALMDQCFRDLGTPGTLYSLSFLKLQQPPPDEKRRKLFLDKIEPMAKPSTDPKIAADPGHIATVAEAQAVCRNWGQPVIIPPKK
jgi:predicted Zn finger-like uncharacterized protein